MFKKGLRKNVILNEGAFPVVKDLFFIVEILRLRLRMTVSILFLFFLISCAASPPPAPSPSQTGTLYRTYEATYDEVWSAALKALSKYQIPVQNKDSGILKTDFILGHSKEPLYSGGEKFDKENKWKLSLTFLNLEMKDGKSLVRVRIEKEEYINPGFMESWNQVASDLLTEKTILYRIGRIIELDQKIEKLTTPQ